MVILDGNMGYWDKFLVYTVDEYTDIYINSTVKGISGIERRDYIINLIKRNVKN
jgi:hypothetical protein